MPPPRWRSACLDQGARGFALRSTTTATGSRRSATLEPVPRSQHRELDRTLIRMLGRKPDRIRHHRCLDDRDEPCARAHRGRRGGRRTREQEARLRELGCDLVQGYYHAAPMTVTDLQGLFARSVLRSDTDPQVLQTAIARRPSPVPGRCLANVDERRDKSTSLTIYTPELMLRSSLLVLRPYAAGRVRA